MDREGQKEKHKPDRKKHGQQGSWPWRNPATRQRENLPHFSKITLVSSLRAVQETSDHFFYSALNRRFCKKKTGLPIRKEG